MHAKKNDVNCFFIQDSKGFIGPLSRKILP